MKKINDYRKLFEATPVSTLADLKSTYRNFMKAYHPDKFQDEEAKADADVKSREMIEGMKVVDKIELRKRNKLVKGTIVEFDGNKVKLI